MLVSFALGIIVAVGSFVSMRGHLDSAAMQDAPLGLTTVLVSLLTPWAIILEIVAIVLVMLDSRLVGGLHRRLSFTAFWFLIAWGVANLGGFLPLSFVALQRGSVELLRLGQMVKALAAVLQYSIPFLLVFGMAAPGVRKLLWPALLLTVIGNFATVAMGGLSMELQPLDGAGAVSYAPRITVDYTRGLYPLTLAMGYAGGLLYILAYGLLLFRRGPERDPASAGSRTSQPVEVTGRRAP
jgi:hypothetical protein